MDDLIHHSKAPAPGTREEVLRLWDEATEQINALWSQIPPHRFQEIDTAFGQYEGPVYGLLLYWIDNEVHHRGQGYVYLRSLGIGSIPSAFPLTGMPTLMGRSSLWRKFSKRPGTCGVKDRDTAINVHNPTVAA